MLNHPCRKICSRTDCAHEIAYELRQEGHDDTLAVIMTVVGDHQRKMASTLGDAAFFRHAYSMLGWCLLCFFAEAGMQISPAQSAAEGQFLARLLHAFWDEGRDGQLLHDWCLVWSAPCCRQRCHEGHLTFCRAYAGFS